MGMEIEIGASRRDCRVTQDGKEVTGIYRIVIVADARCLTRVKFWRYMRETGDKVIVRGVLNQT